MFKKAAIVLVLFGMPFSLMAEDVVGKIQSISVKGKVIQYLNPKTNEVNVIKFTDKTKLESASSFTELTVNTKFKATLDDSGVARKIKRILVKLPEEQVIDTEELYELIDDGQPLFIGDARPVGKYQVGHIPGAKATPASELKQNLHWLPEDKATPLVFYCGGVTCPLSPKALRTAKANGYNNVKAYVEGYPAWKEEVYPSHVNKEWLAENLDIHHIILDVRTSPKSYIKGAVHLPSEKLLKMHEQWNKDKYPTNKRTIFDLRDKKAPIIIVAESDSSDDAIEAYEILTFWKFKNVSILNGGVLAWKQAILPVETGKIADELNYVKKLAKGAIDEKDFVKAVTSGTATVIDVRSVDEVSHGHLKGAINIPLEELDQNLDRIPRTGLVILHCAGGARASLAYTTLINKGYTNVKFLDESLEAVVKDNGIKLI